MRDIDFEDPKWKATLLTEDVALKAYEREHRDVLAIPTRKKSTARVDGFFVDRSSGEVCGVFETKTRQYTLKKTREWGTSLIVNQKLKHLRAFSHNLCVPAYVVGYYAKDDVVVVWQLTDDSGKYLFDFEVKRTRTQASIAGGVAYRQNAFLPLDAAVEYISI